MQLQIGQTTTVKWLPIPRRRKYALIREHKMLMHALWWSLEISGTRFCVLCRLAELVRVASKTSQIAEKERNEVTAFVFAVVVLFCSAFALGFSYGVAVERDKKGPHDRD